MTKHFRVLFFLFAVIFYTGCSRGSIINEEDENHEAEAIETMAPIQINELITQMYISQSTPVSPSLLESTLDVMDVNHSIANQVSFVLGRFHAQNENAIQPRAVNGIYYLFLPYWITVSDIYIFFDTGDTYVMVNGDPITSGSIMPMVVHNKPIWLFFDAGSFMLIPMIGSQIPTIFIHTQSGSLDFIHADQSNREATTFLFVDEWGNYEHSGGGDMNGRGNATWTMPKRPYNFRLASGTSLPLFGMREGRHWTLLANYIDDTRVRNTIALNLARELGISHTSHIRPVDVFINGVYVGVYDLVERRSINHAVHITDLESNTATVNDAPLSSFPHVGVHAPEPGTIKYFDIPNNPEDITGGFLLELELWGRYMNEPSGFVTTRGTVVNLRSPNIASYEQVVYISDLFQRMEDAVYSFDGYNSHGNHFSHYIDVTGFALKYILSEFLMDQDTAISSFFLYKESDLIGSGRIYVGPPWDFDQTLGRSSATAGTTNLRNPQEWWANRGHIHFDGRRPLHLLAALYQHECFRNYVYKLWDEEFAPLVRVLIGYEAQTETLRSIQYYIDLVSASRYMERIIWPLTHSQVSSILHFARARYVFLSEHFVYGWWYDPANLDRYEFYQFMRNIDNREWWLFNQWYNALTPEDRALYFPEHNRYIPNGRYGDVNVRVAN